MKIERVEHWSEPLALTRPYRIANQTITDIDNHFVCLQTADGTCGYGAASPGDGVTGETLQDCDAALELHLEAQLVGKDLRQFPALVRNLQLTLIDRPAALAAVDMALYDLAGKQFGIPLVELLGRRHHSMPTSITIGIQAVAEALEEAEEYIGRGFRFLKLKIGDELEEDIALLRQLREKVGPEIAIRVDANQGYSVDDLLSFHYRTRGFGLELIEQPLPVAQLDQMRALPRELRALCAGDESMRTPADALACAGRPRPFGIYNIKFMKCGGVTPAREMARLAHMAGIDLMWGCNDESCVSIAAALHTALASSATRYVDLDGSFDLGRDLFQGGFELQNGEIRTTGKPGLGVTPLD